MPKFRTTISFEHEMSNETYEYYKSDKVVTDYAPDALNLIRENTVERFRLTTEYDVNEGNYMLDEILGGNMIKIEKVEILDGD